MKATYLEEQNEYVIETAGARLRWPADRLRDLPLLAVDFPVVECPLSLAALGPVSFLDLEGERLTCAAGQTFCATTYVAMMRNGWVN